MTDPLVRYEHIEGNRWRAVFDDGDRCEVTYSRERGYPGLFRGEVHADFYHWAAETLADVRAGRLAVLDVGCGSGYGSKILAHYGHHVLGCDVSEEAVRYARIRYDGHARFLRGGFEDLPAKDASMDAVVSSDSFEHTEDGQRAAEEIARVLKPGGVVLITTPNAEKSDGDNEHHPVEYTPAELAALLLRAGFADVKQCRFTRWPGHFGMVAVKT